MIDEKASEYLENDQEKTNDIYQNDDFAVLVAKIPWLAELLNQYCKLSVDSQRDFRKKLNVLLELFEKDE